MACMTMPDTPCGNTKTSLKVIVIGKITFRGRDSNLGPVSYSIATLIDMMALSHMSTDSIDFTRFINNTLGTHLFTVHLCRT